MHTEICALYIRQSSPQTGTEEKNFGFPDQNLVGGCLFRLMCGRCQSEDQGHGDSDTTWNTYINWQ